MASLIGKALGAGSNGPPVPLGDGSPMRMPGMVTSGSTDQALLRAYKSNGTVNSNVSLLASSVAKPAWKLFRQPASDGRQRYSTSDQGSDERVEVIRHAALNVLNNPAVITIGGVRWQPLSRFRLMEVSGIWLETAGKSHWVVDHPEGSALPLGLWPVRPDRIRPVPSTDRYLAGWIYTSPDGGERIPLLPTEVIFNCYPDPEDIYGGAGPIGSVLTDVQTMRYAGQWQMEFFLNSAEPGGVIQVDHQMEDDEFNSLVDRWRESHRGVARSHRVAILEQGTFVPNPRTQKEMDFVNGRTATRDIIREALGMHKIMTGVSEDVNRANAQTGEEVFASWKVAPRLDRWRDVLNYQLLPLFGATGEGVEFDYLYPMPQNREQDNAELTAKTAAFKALIDAGVDPDAAAAVVGLPKMAMAQRAVQQDDALPPGWVATPGGDGASAPTPAQEAAQAALDALLRRRGLEDGPPQDRLPWRPFRLDDARFAAVNGHSLIGGRR